MLLPLGYTASLQAILEGGNEQYEWTISSFTTKQLLPLLLQAHLLIDLKWLVLLPYSHSRRELSELLESKLMQYEVNVTGNKYRLETGLELVMFARNLPEVDFVTDWVMSNNNWRLLSNNSDLQLL